MVDVRGIAFYLPQFHPIAENDEWWGRGFTEWRNVAKARPLFAGHYQPHLPGELGFYDLRVPEVRVAQADLAREHGLAGFCYYHYWFHGKRLLERPFQEVLDSGDPAFPFSLCWANENWTRTWDGGDSHVLMPQSHSDQDDLDHLRWLAPVFSDPRYIRVDGKPLFLVYRAKALKDAARTTDVWRREASRLGLGELFLCRVETFAEERNEDPRRLGFDAAVEWIPDSALLGPPLMRDGLRYRLGKRWGALQRPRDLQRIYSYDRVVEAMSQTRTERVGYQRFPCVVPSWDNSARRSKDAMIFKDATPDQYERWLADAAARARAVSPADPVVFISAWNEWAEGNHLEPDARWGRAYLEATARALGRS